MSHVRQLLDHQLNRPRLLAMDSLSRVSPRNRYRKPRAKLKRWTSKRHRDTSRKQCQANHLRFKWLLLILIATQAKVAKSESSSLLTTKKHKKDDQFTMSRRACLSGKPEQKRRSCKDYRRAILRPCTRHRSRLLTIGLRFRHVRTAWKTWSVHRRARMKGSSSSRPGAHLLSSSIWSRIVPSCPNRTQTTVS